MIGLQIIYFFQIRFLLTKNWENLQEHNVLKYDYFFMTLKSSFRQFEII